MAEEKKATRTRKPKATEEVTEKPVTEEVKDNTSNEIEQLKQMVELLQKQLAEATKPQIIYATAANPNEEKIHFLWQAEVADDNTVVFGDGGMYGRIVGKTGHFYVPHSELSRILDSTNRSYLDKRWLIVISGLTDEEKDALGVNYKEGEILDERMFNKMLDLGNEIIDVYADLCEEHKEIVAKRFFEAHENGRYIPRETVVKLNKIRPNDAFKKIIGDINEAELGE